MLSLFAGQVGVAAHAARVTRDLRRSREQVVVTAEEERRQLRRDLHDGVGPTLAGVALGLGSAAQAARREGSARAALLEALHAEVLTCLEDVRRISHDLRPAALDELGLVSALRQHAAAISGRGDVHVTVHAPPAWEPLPAAVELTAYRIAMEALTNVQRHARARSCDVSVALNGDLTVTVADDGTGVPPLAAGIGMRSMRSMRSMRERAELLGGSCAVSFEPGRGTTVTAALPVAPP